MAKRKRANSTSDELTSVEATHILDLPDECLQHVFSFLPAFDLCAVKKTCPRFVNPADDAFKAQYRHRPLNLIPEFEDFPDRYSSDRFYRAETTVYNFKTFISALNFFNVVTEREDGIFSIMSVCPALKELKLTECALKACLFSSRHDILSRLESLQISNCFGNEQSIQDLLGHCLKLKRLTIEYDTYSLKPDHMPRHFPKLQEITIRGWDCDENIQFDRSLPKFIKANPQLKKINFNFDYVKCDILPVIAAHSRKLKSLSLQLNDVEHNQSVEKLAKLRRLKHLRELQISCAAFNDSIAPAIEALAERNLLHTLSISDAQLDSVLRRTICKLTNLETLKLVRMSVDNASVGSLGDLTEKLGKLKHLHVIDCQGILCEHIVPIIERSKTLETLTFFSFGDQMRDEYELFSQVLARNSSGATMVLKIFLIDCWTLSEQQRKQMNETGCGRIQLKDMDVDTEYVYICERLDDKFYL